nr:Lrp/AsnC family transcriptional regulator [Pedobacter sp. ASV19]
MFKIPELTATDIQILTILQSNAELPQKQIARLLNKSAPAVYERIRILRKKGYIRNSVALLNCQKISSILTVYTQVQLKDHSSDSLDCFHQQAILFDEVMECYHTTGHYDFNLKVVVPDMPAYNSFMHKLALIPNLSTMASHFVIAEHKRDTAYKLESPPGD